MKTILRITSLALFGLHASASFSQSIVGDWQGGVVVDWTTVPRAASPAQQQWLQNKLQSMTQAKIELVLKSNGTFTFSGGGMPGQPDTQTILGAYSRRGAVVKLSPKSQDGKRVTGHSARPIILKLGAGGRTLTAPLMSEPVITIVVRR